MITKCNYCDYQKSTPAPPNLLQVSADEFSKESEDFTLWATRLVKTIGTADYNSVKIHMGRMHKGLAYKHEIPTGIWEPEEKAIIEGKLLGYGVQG